MQENQAQTKPQPIQSHSNQMKANPKQNKPIRFLITIIRPQPTGKCKKNNQKTTQNQKNNRTNQFSNWDQAIPTDRKMQEHQAETKPKPIQNHPNQMKNQPKTKQTNPFSN